MGDSTLLRADARSLPLAGASVDLVVTSPPYFALRSYTDGGEHYAGQIGAEPTPAAYLDGLIEVTRECMRVLKPTGSIWVNLGDKYSTYEGPRKVLQNSELGRRQGSASQTEGARYVKSAPSTYGIPYKSLFGLPWRYAIRCIDDLGLILRAEVIWSKMEWPRRIIQGWSPAGGVVLDPLGGTGTTALIADTLGRRGISVDMSADYLRIAAWRTTDPGQRAKALGTPRMRTVPPVHATTSQATSIGRRATGGGPR